MAILEHPGVAVLYSTVIPDPAPGFPVRPPHKLPSPQASADLGQHSPALIIRYLLGVLFNTCLCHQAVNPRGSGATSVFCTLSTQRVPTRPPANTWGPEWLHGSAGIRGTSQNRANTCYLTQRPPPDHRRNRRSPK